nr:wall-associated receptor kinase 2-like isoform X2 [Setaria viridis]
MMAPTCAFTVLLPAAVVPLMVMTLQLSAAAAAAATAPPRPPVIGQPGCDTLCGNVSVPYPFGFGPSSRCYWPGLNLTCDRRHNPPRLLLGDSALRVTDISLQNETVRVMRAGSIVNATGDNSDSWNASFGPGFTENGYQLSYRNEVVVSGCNVVARILADIMEKTPRIIGGCASFCTIIDRDDGPLTLETMRESKYKYCTGTAGCCQASVSASGTPNAVEAKWLYSGNHTAEQHLRPAIVFIAEEGWVDKNGLLADELEEVPIVLEWSVTQGLSHWNDCDDGMIQRVLCKSEQSRCSSGLPGSFTCQCEDGYYGNPYLLGGCQDIDECELPSEENGCFGDCINTIGSMECRCPHGTFGNPGIRGGCVKISSTTDPQLPTVAPVPLGLPHCNTTCGDVSVPYPFGISRGCYRPGFNLTCSTSYDPPRLLLDSNGTLEVINISLHDSTVRVIHHARTSNNATFVSGYPTIVDCYIPDVGEPYMLSTKNEFIFFGCNVEATLYGEYRNDSSNSTDRIISRCNSTCSSGSKYILYKDHSARPLGPTHTNGGYCSGRDDGCCHAPIAADSTPKRMEFKGLNLHTKQEYNFLRAVAFISEDRLTDQWYMTLNRTDISMSLYMSSPYVLRWAVKQGFPAPAGNMGQCPKEVANRLCESKDSSCRQEYGGFTCHCNPGYQGNPYVPGGCQVVDECRIMALSRKLCFGECINFPGGHECRCPRGSYGNPYKPSGCYPAGLIIGLSVASGAALLPMVLGIVFVHRKIKQRRVKALKQKYFKQNRGQLLQQLLSQKADIAERMIIPVDELAKATNNFDKAREIGGGGHGTVYKGILSDLHVVAIKKSKITVQKEIDEFINEVAILSQINHKNVVKLFGCCLETEVPLLVYEFISNGTLYHHLHVEGPMSLSWRHRLRIATEIASSLAYLHSTVLNPIIHRDIKSSNILLDDKLMAKVSDFGASRYIPMDNEGLTTRIQGTRGYMDPMCFHTGRLTEKSDVYSFGVLLVELLTRKKPFSYLSTEGDRLAAHFVNLLAKGNVTEIIDPQVIEEGGEEIQEVAALAASCVNVRSEERPTMRQVEHILEGLWGSKKYKKDDTNLEKFQKQAEGQRNEESSRRYSLEQEMMMSSTYPR